MIPKPLNEIEWSDLEALKDSGREEDDTIEFKGSFSGGLDFLAFNEKQQAVAVDGIVKEVIAFLNGRGGDVVIGAREFKNEHPKIEALASLPNVVSTVDRLAQALSAMIEPTQSILAMRAVMNPAKDGEGLIVIRTPSSLRAPHRSRRTKECYVRRGRESVPMPMDEVQDLVLRRANAQSDRLAILDRQFQSLTTSKAGRCLLDGYRVHFRCCFVPIDAAQIQLDDSLLTAFRAAAPELSADGRSERNEVAFRQLSGKGYRSILRGMAQEAVSQGVNQDDGFAFVSRSIRTDGVMQTDFACRRLLSDHGDPQIGFHVAWVVGFLAHSLASIHAVQKQQPQLANGFLRIGIHCHGPMQMRSRQGLDLEKIDWPEGTEILPDFDIDGFKSLAKVFRQIQWDISGLAGLDDPLIYEFVSRP